MWDDRLAQGGSCLWGMELGAGENLSLQPPEVPSYPCPGLAGVRSQRKSQEPPKFPGFGCLSTALSWLRRGVRKDPWWGPCSPLPLAQGLQMTLPPTRACPEAGLEAGETWQRSGCQVAL